MARQAPRTDPTGGHSGKASARVVKHACRCVTQCSTEWIREKKNEAEAKGKCLCRGPMCENIHTTHLLKNNIFNISDKTTGQCNRYFPTKDFQRKGSCKFVFTYQQFEVDIVGKLYMIVSIKWNWEF